MPTADVNAIAAGLLFDLGSAQTSPQKAFAYKHAARAVLELDEPLTALAGQGGALPKIPRIGPSSTRVLLEVMATGGSTIVEQAVAESSRREAILEQRTLRGNFFSRAEVRRILADDAPRGLTMADYRGDFQMHSEWSDGSASLAELAAACIARGYRHAAVTDHSYGLKIAKGMSMAEAAAQHLEIDRLNAHYGPAFRLLKGVEANIDAGGALDLTPAEVARFEIVLAAPHAKLRSAEDQTDRLLRVLGTPGIHVLAHPRGRMSGSRAGVVADWDRVFARAAEADVAVEIDGDPSRQDVDHTLAARASRAGCLFALDSDAHSPNELVYAETAVAHARLAGIAPARIINCWSPDRLMRWLARRHAPRGRRAPRPPTAS